MPILVLKNNCGMRYIDRTNCKSMSDKGADSEIIKMGKLSRTATKIAEEAGLGLLKTHFGTYRVIRECGLVAYRTDLSDLAAVDDFLKNLEAHKADRL
jgi:hypothetical protein